MSDTSIGPRYPADGTYSAQVEGTTSSAAEEQPNHAAAAAAAAARAQTVSESLGLSNIYGTSTNKYTGATPTASLPLPTLPALPTTAISEQGAQSFIQDAKGSLSAAAQYTATLPQNQVQVPLTSPAAKTPAQVINQAVQFGLNQAKAPAELQKATVFELLLGRLQTDQDTVKNFKGLLTLSSDSQSLAAKQQTARNEEAQKAAKKAADKAGSLGIFSKLFTAIIAVVSVVIAVATFGVGTPASAAILAAAVVAFATGGAVSGSKNGTGFDLFAGLDAFSTALGIAGIAAALKGVVQGALQTAVKFLTQGIKSATGSSAQQSVGGGALAAKTALGQSSTGAGVGAGGAADAASKEVFEQVTSNILKSFAGGAKLTPKQLAILQGTFAGTSATEQIATGGVQLKIANLNADSKDDLAVSQLLKAFIDKAGDNYKTVQDTVQTVVKAHNDAFDSAGQIVQERGEVARRIAQAY